MIKSLILLGALLAGGPVHEPSLNYAEVYRAEPSPCFETRQRVSVLALDTPCPDKSQVENTIDELLSRIYQAETAVWYTRMIFTSNAIECGDTLALGCTIREATSRNITVLVQVQSTRRQTFWVVKHEVCHVTQYYRGVHDPGHDLEPLLWEKCR
jgi:hypothetical protein